MAMNQDVGGPDVWLRSSLRPQAVPDVLFYLITFLLFLTNYAVNRASFTDRDYVKHW